MASSDFDGYCSFTKAIEHLGERWTLLIVRELGMFGPQGFNALAVGLPGHISRSVLANRLRNLQDLGLVTRSAAVAGQGPYQLTSGGNELLPTILSLRGWAETWIPDDASMVDRDPDIILAWLADRIDPASLPAEKAVVEVTYGQQLERRCWLVLERDMEPYGCFEDPLLDESRYVYVEAGTSVLLVLARGRRDWSEAMADRSIMAFGDPGLVVQFTRWFRPADPSVRQAPDMAPAAFSPSEARLAS